MATLGEVETWFFQMPPIGKNVKMSSMYAPYKKQLAPETCDWLYYLYNFIITKGGALTVVRCHQFDGFHRHRLVALGSETDGVTHGEFVQKQVPNLCSWWLNQPFKQH